MPKLAVGKSVAAFLAELPPEKRKVMSAVRAAIKKNLPKGYEESVQGRLIAYTVPLATLPKTYNSRPLWYAALASQKNYFTVHLITAYSDKKELAFIQDGFKKAGKKLDMGKGCIRFRKLEELPLDVIGKSVARTSVDALVRIYQSVKRK